MDNTIEKIVNLIEQLATLLEDIPQEELDALIKDNFGFDLTDFDLSGLDL